MGTKERKEREKEQRKQAILDAAESVFFSKGFLAATVDDIAAEAELSKGAIYLYFPGKEDIAAAIVLRAIRLLNSAFSRASASETVGLKKIEAIGRAFVRFFREHTAHARFMNQMSDYKKDNSELPHVIQCATEGAEAYRIMVDAIITGQQDGSIRKELDPMMTALTLSSFSEGLLQMVTLQGDLVEQIMGRKIEELFDFAFGFMARGLE